MAGHPLKGDGRGIHILNFLKTFARNIHPTICEMWETVIPKLTVIWKVGFFFAVSSTFN